MNKRIKKKRIKLHRLDGKNFIGHFLRAEEITHLRFKRFECRHYSRWGHPSRRNSFVRSSPNYGRYSWPFGIGDEVRDSQQTLILQQGELSCWRVSGSTELISALQNKTGYSEYYTLEVRQQDKLLGYIWPNFLGWNFRAYQEGKPPVEFLQWAAPQLNLMGFNYEGKGW